MTFWDPVKSLPKSHPDLFSWICTLNQIGFQVEEGEGGWLIDIKELVIFSIYLY
jgi:hypothetical protein